MQMGQYMIDLAGADGYSRMGRGDPHRQKKFVLWSEGVLWRQNYVGVEVDV